MKRISLFVPITAALLFAGALVSVQSVEADPIKGKDFLGLWEGIDDSDGSSVTVSVTDQDDDGVFRILWHESQWSFCDGSPDGLIDVSGPIEDTSIVAEGMLTCFETGDTVCFGITGCSQDDLPPFSLDIGTGAGDTLTNSDGGNTIIIHKISE